MPSEIENYVHRIGRTGRSGKRGLATSFVSKTLDPSFLLDLKHLLEEAKQQVPEFLIQLTKQVESPKYKTVPNTNDILQELTNTKNSSQQVSRNR